MTYLEIHTGENVQRFAIEGMPVGNEEKDATARVDHINRFIRDFNEKVGYCYKESQYAIIHESKMNHGKEQRIAENRA